MDLYEALTSLAQSPQESVIVCLQTHEFVAETYFGI